MKKLLYLLFSISLFCCRDRYESPVISPDTGYLVVEGFINTGLGGTSISLSRVNKLNDPVIAKVTGAVVQVEADNNQVYPLAAKADGVYASEQLVLQNDRSYRLTIRTPDNKEYQTAFAKPVATPAIDSISWQYTDSGLEIFVNTHDPANNTKYYRWQYEQTWEIRSSYYSTLKYVTTQVQGRPFYSVDFLFPNGAPDTTKIRCWQGNNSTTIILGSTAKLTKDIISMPLIDIPRGTRPLSIMYSVLVRQHAITKAEYEFLEIMKKNTELTGSVFDPQPSQLNGNIKCITNPGEPVVGYVGVYSEQQERVYIRNSQLPGWGFNPGCLDYEIENQTDSIAQAIGNLLLPTTVQTFTPVGRIATFNAAPNVCVDCTLIGTNKKPDFWP
jgi:hypothetical protein